MKALNSEVSVDIEDRRFQATPKCFDSSPVGHVAQMLGKSIFSSEVASSRLLKPLPSTGISPLRAGDGNRTRVLSLGESHWV
jgi:hypothetical protein